jgi:DNA polymerase (family 10)
MDKGQVAAALEEIGLLLDLLGDNPFKTRAYHNGARIVRGLEEDLDELVRRRELTKIKGIGSALAEKITALVERGKLPYLDELREKVPQGLLQWLKIQGLGAKKARAIHVALGISTLGELEYACIENRLRDLPGFGTASQQKILAGIERVRRNAGRFHQHLLQSEAERLLETVQATTGVLHAEVGGAVRRKAETAVGIEIIAAAEDGGPLMNKMVQDEGVAEIIDRRANALEIRLARGPMATLRIVPDERFSFALLSSTGSEAHLAALRELAGEQPLMEAASEAEIYERLGLEWIPPELREDLGEVDAAAEGRLPELIDEGDIRGMLHCHSTWSDGSSSIEEMAETVRGMAMDYLAICDHSRAAAYAGGLDSERVRGQHREIDGLNSRYGGSFRVLKGIEVDILPDGRLDFEDDLLASFDIVVASVHSGFNFSEEKQTARILRALENPYVDVLGHVTGRLLLARDGYALDLKRVLEVAADRDVAVEVNAHPHRLDLDWRNLREGLARGMKTCINPDAHSLEGLRHIRHGVGVARKGWCTKESVLNAWPLDRLLDHLGARR